MTLGPCGKRVYGSKRDAREAHSHAHWRIRTYWCDQCHAWHVTNHEKVEVNRLRKSVKHMDRRVKHDRSEE